MFAKTTNVGFAQRVVATLVASAMVMVSYGFYNTAQAANLTDISNTLSNSAPEQLSGHTIEFNVPTGSSIVSTDVIDITFPVGFDGVEDLVSGDLVVTDPSGTVTIAGFDATTVAQVVSFSGVVATSGEPVIVAITDDVITNPTPGANSESYEFSVTVDNATNDSGKTRVVIINTVEVTAVVETAFEFTISGLGATSSETVNGEATTGSTTATSIPFGVLASEVPKFLAQRLNVTTNARNGFVVTVETDGDLESSTGATIDTFVDGADTIVPTAWVAPANTSNDDNTWGHWGISSDDTDIATPIADGNYIAASTTPREVFSHTGSANGSDANVGQTEVGFKIQITPLQEAGDDYNTTLTYIATPTF